MHHLKFQIKDMRQQNVQDAIQSIAVILAALVIASLLPTLLVTYVYTDQAALMTETPFWIQNGPLVVFGLGIAYFLYVIVANFLRNHKIAQLKQQLLMSFGGHLSEGELVEQQAELNKLEKAVDSALSRSSSSTRRPAKKVAARRRSK